MNIIYFNFFIIVFLISIIQALNSSVDDSCDFEVCKVHAEFHHMKSIMYHSLHRVQIIVLLDGVQREEMPLEFKDLFCFKFPKKLSIKDDICFRLVSLLLDEEPFVIDVSKTVANKESHGIMIKKPPSTTIDMHCQKSSPSSYPLLYDH